VLTSEDLNGCSLLVFGFQFQGISSTDHCLLITRHCRLSAALDRSLTSTRRLSSFPNLIDSKPFINPWHSESKK